MRIKYAIIVLVFSVLLSSCGRSNESTQISNVETEQNMDTKEVICLTNLYKCVIDEKTGKEKYGLLLNEPFVYKGSPFSIGASLYINNEITEDKDISVLCLLLLDGIPIPFSMDDNKLDILQSVVLQNGIEKKVKIDTEPYGVSKESKNLIFLGIPFANKENNEVYENNILYCTNDIVSEKENLPVKGSELQYKSDYIDNIDEMIENVTSGTDNSNGQNRYIHNFIYTSEDKYFFTSDINEGKNETILFCDGKLYEGFDDSSYFLWEGKSEFINMKIDTSKLTAGKHIMSVVTIQDNDGFITASKSLNVEVDIHEQKK